MRRRRGAESSRPRPTSVKPRRTRPTPASRPRSRPCTARSPRPQPRGGLPTTPATPQRPRSGSCGSSRASSATPRERRGAIYPRISRLTRPECGEDRRNHVFGAVPHLLPREAQDPIPRQRELHIALAIRIERPGRPVPPIRIGLHHEPAVRPVEVADLSLNDAVHLRQRQTVSVAELVHQPFELAPDVD